MSSGSHTQNVECNEEDLDQRTFDAAPPNAHNDLDSKDQRSLANRAAAAQRHERDADAQKEKAENQRTVTDPLAPARAHGNEPSRGAKVDAQLKADDEALLRNKTD